MRPVAKTRADDVVPAIILAACDAYSSQALERGVAASHNWST